jgi:HD-GYP domain-containing protein (c-di-GMP phosphodiesterase class II)
LIFISALATIDILVNKGEKGSEEQIARYSSNGAKFLYFLTEDRADFISYQNEVLAKNIKSGGDSGKIIKNLKTVSDKYIEEVYTVGLQPHLIEEGKAVCENVYQFVQKDSNLRRLLSQLEEFNPVAYSHSFLTCFFATLISQNLEWIGTKTREALSMGAMFHDIGLIQIPEAITSKQIVEMSPEEKFLFQSHPEKGRDSLANVPQMTKAIVEIVAQHHELSDGTGFPYGLSGSKIFPMAKVVGLSDAFASLITDKEISPLDGLKEFLNTRENLTKYEPDLLKNLIKGFIPEKKR